MMKLATIALGLLTTNCAADVPRSVIPPPVITEPPPKPRPKPTIVDRRIDDLQRALNAAQQKLEQREAR